MTEQRKGRLIQLGEYLSQHKPKINNGATEYMEKLSKKLGLSLQTLYRHAKKATVFIFLPDDDEDDIVIVEKRGN